jgi:agmatine/peptidylarginine deiminase
MIVSRRLLVLALLALAVPASSSSTHVRRAMRGRAEPPPPTEASLFYNPTPALPVASVTPEFEPVSALVVALPAQVLGNRAKEEFFVDLIEAAARYVRVFALVNRDEHAAVPAIRALVRARTRDAEAVLARVTFVRGVVDTEWIRDYGPLFAAGQDGEPVLLDGMYRDVRSEAETARTFARLGLTKTYEPPARGGPAYLSDYGHFWRMNDDAAPLYFNEMLYLARRRFAPLVRPPLELWGGDLAFVGERRLLTSTRTLEANGGDEPRFRRLLKEYFNVDDAVYLRPLPNGIWHIDMFVKPASPRVMLLGDFAAASRAPGDAADLRDEAAAVIAWNKALLEARLPGVRIVSVPMPPILKPATTAVYRSFLNSVVLNAGSGRSAVLIPRFTGLEHMEPAVTRAYREAFPGADLHFINADAMVEEYAGPHCVTVTIPVFDAGTANAR